MRRSRRIAHLDVRALAHALGYDEDGNTYDTDLPLEWMNAPSESTVWPTNREEAEARGGAIWFYDCLFGRPVYIDDMLRLVGIELGVES